MKIIGRVHQKVASNVFHLTTETESVLMMTSENLEINLTYSFPLSVSIDGDDQMFKAHETLKPTKTRIPVARDVPKEVFEVLLQKMENCTTMKSSNSSNKPTEPIQSFRQVLNGNEKVYSGIKSVHCKIKKLLKDIEGNYGNYDVTEVKDLESNVTTIYWYKLRVTNEKVGDIVNLLNLRVARAKYENAVIKSKLETTASSRSNMVDETVKALFSSVLLVSPFL